MSVEQPIIKDINKIFQGTLLGKGKVEKSVRMNLFGNQDLSSARKEYLSHIKRADEDFDSMDPDNLALAISIQTKAIALSKKEKGQTEEDPDKKALRDEIKKEEGFCKKLFDYTQDKTHLDKVNQALAILAEEINDHLRANRGIELKNGISDPNLLKKKQIRLVEANKNVDIKERTKMDEKEKAKLREYLATKELKFGIEESPKAQPEEKTEERKLSSVEKWSEGMRIAPLLLAGITAAVGIEAAGTATAILVNASRETGVGIIGAATALATYALYKTPSVLSMASRWIDSDETEPEAKPEVKPKEMSQDDLDLLRMLRKEGVNKQLKTILGSEAEVSQLISTQLGEEDIEKIDRIILATPKDFFKRDVGNTKKLEDINHGRTTLIHNGDIAIGYMIEQILNGKREIAVILLEEKPNITVNNAYRQLIADRNMMSFMRIIAECFEMKTEPKFIAFKEAVEIPNLRTKVS